MAKKLSNQKLFNLSDANVRRLAELSAALGDSTTSVALRYAIMSAPIPNKKRVRRQSSPEAPK